MTRKDRGRHGGSAPDPGLEFVRELQKLRRSRPLGLPALFFPWLSVVATVSAPAVLGSGLFVLFGAVALAAGPRTVGFAPPWHRWRWLSLPPIDPVLLVLYLAAVAIAPPLLDPIPEAMRSALAGSPRATTSPAAVVMPQTGLVASSPTPATPAAALRTLAPTPVVTAAATPGQTSGPIPAPTAVQRQVEQAVDDANALWVEVVSRLGQPGGYSSSTARAKLAERWGDEALNYLMTMIDRYLAQQWYFGADSNVTIARGTLLEARPGVWQITVREARHLVTRKLAGEGARASADDCIIEINDEIADRLQYELTRGRGAGAPYIVQTQGTRVTEQRSSFATPRC